MHDLPEVLMHLRTQYRGVFDEARIQAHVRDYLGHELADLQVRDILHRLPSRGRLLDIGSGYGSFVIQARAAGLDAQGLEIETFELERARRRLARTRPEDDPERVFVEGDGLALPFSQATFDLVTLWNVLEHVPDYRRLLNECVRVLKPGGRILLVAPNYAAVRKEAHYHVLWLPLLPRRLASQYLRMRGREPAFFEDSIHYCTLTGVRRYLRGQPVQVRDPLIPKVRNPEAIDSTKARRIAQRMRTLRLSWALEALVRLRAANPLRHTIHLEIVRSDT